MSSILKIYPSQGAIQPTSYNEEDSPLYVMPSYYLMGSKSLSAGLLPVRYQFSPDTKVVRLFARLTNLRFYVGDSSVTASNSTSHWLPRGGQIMFSLRNTDTHLAVVRAHLSPQDGVLEISEFGFE